MIKVSESVNKTKTLFVYLTEDFVGRLRSRGYVYSNVSIQGDVVGSHRKSLAVGEQRGKNSSLEAIGYIVATAYLAVFRISSLEAIGYTVAAVTAVLSSPEVIGYLKVAAVQRKLATTIARENLSGKTETSW